jgi:hypothetical protein
MRSRNKRGITVGTLVLIAAVMQAYVGIGLAARTTVATVAPAAPQELSGILTTGGNKPITVNGAAAGTGATILNGVTVETPDQVTASINIPGHGIVDISANTKFTMEFSATGIKIMLIQGCLVLHTVKGTSGEVDNAQGVIGKADPANDGKIDTCAKKVPGAAAAGGLSTGAKVGIAAAAIGGGTALAFGLRGSNPSPSTP